MQAAQEGLKMIDYNDRGRLKWAGFYLSDHTEKIDADNEQRANQNLAKEQMTTEEVAEVLNAAVIKIDQYVFKKKNETLKDTIQKILLARS